MRRPHALKERRIAGAPELLQQVSQPVRARQIPSNRWQTNGEIRFGKRRDDSRS